MLIFYGTKSAHLGSEQPQHLTCPHCESKGSTVLSVFRHHFHIFWIPMFPIGKVGGSQCQACQTVMKPGQMPDDVAQEYQRLKSQVRGPIWQFAGLFVIAALIAIGSYAVQRDNERELAYSQDPLEGDVYEYKSRPGYYSTFRIEKLTADSAVVLFNDYEVDGVSGIYKIDKTVNYTEDYYTMARETLKEMYDAGDVVGINRD